MKLRQFRMQYNSWVLLGRAVDKCEAYKTVKNQLRRDVMKAREMVKRGSRTAPRPTWMKMG